MRCYEVSYDECNDGLAVLERENLGLTIKTQQHYQRLQSPVPDILLDEALSRKWLEIKGDSTFGTEARLQRCDLEDRGTIWLVPETLETSNQVLLACRFGQDRFLSYNRPPITFAVDGAGSSIISAATFKHGTIAGQMALVHLMPGGSLIIAGGSTTLTLNRAKLYWRYSCDASGKLTRQRK